MVYGASVARDELDKKALGARLRAARVQSNLTLDQVGKLLGDAGFSAKKAAISAWELGRNVPDALVLKRLAKIYNQSTDALLWDDALSLEALQIAASFEALSPSQKSALKTIWMAFVTEGHSGSGLPSTPPPPQSRPPKIAR